MVAQADTLENGVEPLGAIRRREQFEGAELARRHPLGAELEEPSLEAGVVHILGRDRKPYPGHSAEPACTHGPVGRPFRPQPARAVVLLERGYQLVPSHAHPSRTMADRADGTAPASRVAPVRILSVTHGPTVPGGVFEEVVQAAGHELERWVVPFGGMPQPVSSYDALMVFGGSMHPDQDEQFAWLEREVEILARALVEDVPVLGVCLGAQLLARAAGAWVGPAPEPEVGWFEVELTAEGLGDPVLGVLAPQTETFQWHHYTFGIPERRDRARTEQGMHASASGRRTRLGDPVPRRSDARNDASVDERGS